jgi:hypothetical protein
MEREQGSGSPCPLEEGLGNEGLQFNCAFLLKRMEQRAIHPSLRSVVAGVRFRIRCQPGLLPEISLTSKP